MLSGWVLTGAAFGFTTQLYTNALRKLPLTRYPWEYVFLTGLGALGGHFLDGAATRARIKVEALQARRKDLAKGPPEEVL